MSVPSKGHSHCAPSDGTRSLGRADEDGEGITVNVGLALASTRQRPAMASLSLHPTVNHVEPRDVEALLLGPTSCEHQSPDVELSL